MSAMTTEIRLRYAALVLASAFLSAEVGAQPLTETPGEAEDVSFMSGGVGQREQSALIEEADFHDLLVTFARRSDGAYLANVEVTVLGPNGDAVIHATTEGPILLADMPAGSYTILARVPGWEEERRIVEISGEARQSVHFGFVPAGGEAELSREP